MSIRWTVSSRVFLTGILLLMLTLPVHADKGGVVRFATLPPGPGNPEGIAADTNGNIYVATFDFTTTNAIHIFGDNGRLSNTILLPTSPNFVVPLGLAFDAAGNLYVADFGNGDVLKFEPPFTASSTPANTFDVCDGPLTTPPPPSICGLNAMTFDANGDLLVSDSFGGNIFKIDLPNGLPSTFFTHDALKPAIHLDPAFNAFPPFGANGLAFNASGTALFIANTGDDRILKLNLVNGAPTTLETFTESVNGADGILFDGQGRLWVALNQADEVVALNANGRIVERLGSFEGIGPDRAPRGLLFPASIVLSRGSIFVTNAALVLTPALGDEPEEDVSTFTVSRIPIGKTEQ
jgi:sugar lactone lactonase YvrE